LKLDVNVNVARQATKQSHNVYSQKIANVACPTFFSWPSPQMGTKGETELNNLGEVCTFIKLGRSRRKNRGQQNAEESDERENLHQEKKE
jgi:hypothetical protein